MDCWDVVRDSMLPKVVEFAVSSDGKESKTRILYSGFILSLIKGDTDQELRLNGLETRMFLSLGRPGSPRVKAVNSIFSILSNSKPISPA